MTKSIAEIVDHPVVYNDDLRAVIRLLVLIAVIGLVTWAITQIPMDPIIKRVIIVVAAVVAVLFALRAFALI